MATVTTKLHGLKGLERTLSKYPQEVEKQVRFTIEAVARKVQDDARENAPVDTSNLQGSIQVDLSRLDDLYAEVKTALEYARAQEFGFTGEVQVSAHRRTIDEAFGEPIQERTIDVSAHTRKMDIPGTYYMTRAAAAHKQTWRLKIRDAVQRAGQNAS